MHVDESRSLATITRLVDPSRVRMARELELWTQQELASHLPISAAALSQIETGNSSPSASTLQAIAAATGCDPYFFVRRFGDRPGSGFFRSMRSATARKRRRSIARARLLHDLTEVMEEYVDLPAVNVPNLPLTSDDPTEIEDAAAAVRRIWKVDPGPIPHVVRLLERNGVVVVRSQLFEHDVDAFSVFFDDRPIVVLASDKGVTARSRMDAAHELAHLVLHRDVDPQTPGVEDQATAFASAFLMPRTMIQDELPSTADWGELMRLKAKWRVSMHALVWRAFLLGAMNERQFDNARKALSARGWIKQEPEDDQLGPVEMPILLHRALEVLATMGHRVEDLAEQGALPIRHVDEVLRLTRTQKPAIEV